MPLKIVFSEIIVLHMDIYGKILGSETKEMEIALASGTNVVANVSGGRVPTTGFGRGRGRGNAGGWGSFQCYKCEVEGHYTSQCIENNKPTTTIIIIEVQLVTNQLVEIAIVTHSQQKKMKRKTKLT